MMHNDGKILLSFLLKPTVKAVIIGVCTIVVGLLTSFVASWENDNLHFIGAFFLFLVCLFYLGFMIFYATNETNLHKAYGELKNQNEAYALTMANLATTFKHNSVSINLVARYFAGVEDITHLEWHFDTICQTLCEKIYEVICKIRETGEDFSVSYIKRINTGKNDDIVVKMIAYYNDGYVQPHIYDQKRTAKEPNPFLDIRLFEESNPDPVVLLNPREIINSGFHYKCEKDRDRYKQYIGIPVFCSGTHMDGLLQVTVENNSILKSEKRDLEYFAKKTLIPYAHLFLLFSKVDKVIISKQRFLEDKNEKEN